MAKTKPTSENSAKHGNSGKSLVIVESPAKAKTINKYLGRGYVVKACKGHVRDLPKRKYGIDPGRNFAPEYEVLPSHEKIVNELREDARKAETVYLATDLDREGEAIAWHLASALELVPERTRRVVFNEITKSAITEAFEKAHEIDTDKVNAQQARRILDRVVGYELSPLLWKKIAKGLSAGRVQSVAVRLIVEREDAIRAFQPEEYWSIDPIFTANAADAAKLAADWRKFLGSTNAEGKSPSLDARNQWLTKHGCLAAELVEYPAGSAFRPTGRVTGDAKKGWKFESAAGAAIAAATALGCAVREKSRTPRAEYAHFGQETIVLEGDIAHAKAPSFKIAALETKRRSTRPSGPFTTASLQQAAANQLRFSTTRTMKVAQALYEGIDLKEGEGPVGLITYMRTDSTNLSRESITAVRGYIEKQYGAKYLPEQPQRYGSSERAQEAHEAIRPTDPSRTPQALEGHLSDEQLRLYRLIWERFVACQMKPAEWDTTTVTIHAEVKDGVAVFRASGRVLVFDGFYRVMGLPQGEPILPGLKEGQPVAPLEMLPEQKYTAPPARFTEASLVKELETQGIGRPSTYAAIIQTIQSRGYVEQLDRRFQPTARGELVTRKLVDHFPKIMDVKFTSFMEEELDKIESAHLDWVHVLHEFYDPFKESLARAHEEMSPVRAEPSEYTCDRCGKPMVYRFGRDGRFLACTGYPDCTNAMDVDRDNKPIRPVVTDIKCEKCGKPMQMRRSRLGPFLGCTGYPECSSTRPCDDQGVPLRKVKPEELHEKCTECGGEMGVRFARGKSFLGCKNYPSCKATRPIPAGIYIEKPPAEQAGVPCNLCGRPMVIRKSRRGPFLSCSGFPRCRNAKPMEKLEELRQLAASGQVPTPPADDAPAKRGRTAPRGKSAARKPVDVSQLGAPPPGFAWTRTGRPVVEVMPESGKLGCPECGGEMTLKSGRFGPFFGCGKCRATANLRGEAKKQAEATMPAPDRPKPIPTEVICPECGAKMLARMGRTGRFLGCSNYPKCKKTMEVPPGLLRDVAAVAE